MTDHSPTTASAGATIAEFAHAPRWVSGGSGTVGGLHRFSWIVAGLTVVRMGATDDPGGVTTSEQSARRAGVTASGAGWTTPLQGMASMGAGAIHAAAAGIHAEHPTLSRLFVAVAAAQILVGLVTLLRGGRAVAAASALINGLAVVAWIVTRVSGISWISGLEQSEAPQFADTVCAALGALAVGAAVVTLRGGAGRTMRTTPTRLGLPAIALGAVAVAAMMSGATHAHSSEAGQDHNHGEATDDHNQGATTTAHPHGEAPGTTVAHAHDAGAQDPATVAYDPTKPIDLSGIDGVSLEQQAFAENLVAVNVVRLPRWADPAVAEAAGFHSIGDARQRPRALRAVGLDRRRRVARPGRAREPGLRTAAGRQQEARLGDVHAAARHDARGGTRLRRCADAVARPR